MNPKIVFCLWSLRIFAIKISNYSCIRSKKNYLIIFLCVICTSLKGCLSAKSVIWSLYSQDMDHLMVTWFTGPSILFFALPLRCHQSDSSTDVHFKEELQFQIPVFRIVAKGPKWTVLEVDGHWSRLFGTFLAQLKALESWTEKFSTRILILE